MAEGARVLVLGMSTTEICGVRDHAELLAAELRAEGLGTSVHWLYRSEESLRGSRAEIGEWVASLSRLLSEDPPALVILHYSVFAFSFRGVPLSVGGVTRALRRAGVPVLVISPRGRLPLVDRRPTGQGLGGEPASGARRGRANELGHARDGGIPGAVALIAPLAGETARRAGAGLLQPARAEPRRQGAGAGRSDWAVRLLLRGGRRRTCARRA